MFNKIKNIITLENEKNLDLISYSTDFKEGLLQALKEIFPNKRGVGCYFHYCKNLKQKFNKDQMK
jgi:transposase-like protein